MKSSVARVSNTRCNLIFKVYHESEVRHCRLAYRPGTIYKSTFGDGCSYKVMQNEDARKQSRAVLHERRKQVVRMHRKGVGVMQIVEQTDLSWTAVNTALRLYGEGSMATLKPGIRGKKPGSGRSLTRAQEQAIQQTICGNRPEQLKMDHALWSSTRPLRPKPKQKVQRFTGAMRQRGSSPMSGAGATRQWGKLQRKVTCPP